jgi:hypothetical protein
MAQRFQGRNWEPRRPFNRGFYPQRGGRGGQYYQEEFQLTQEIPAIDVIIPRQIQEGVQSVYYENKVVFAFEGYTCLQKATQWTETFNKHSAVTLEIVEQLAHNLYMIAVHAENPAREVKKLLASSPLALKGHDTKRASKELVLRIKGWFLGGGRERRGYSGGLGPQVR